MGKGALRRSFQWSSRPVICTFVVSFAPLIGVKVQNDLLNELNRAQALRDAQENAVHSARFELFFQAFRGFFTGAHRQVYDLFSPLVDAMKQNDPLGRLKRGVRSARANTTHRAGLLLFLNGLRDFLAEVRHQVEGWVGSSNILGCTSLTWPQVRLRILFTIVVIPLLMPRGRPLWDTLHSPHAIGSQ